MQVRGLLYDASHAGNVQPIKILHAIQAIHPPLLLNANGNLIPRCMIRAVDKLLAKDPDNRYEAVLLPSRP